jgi:hypothetical protein
MIKDDSATARIQQMGKDLNDLLSATLAGARTIQRLMSVNHAAPGTLALPGDGHADPVADGSLDDTECYIGPLQIRRMIEFRLEFLVDTHSNAAVRERIARMADHLATLEESTVLDGVPALGGMADHAEPLGDGPIDPRHLAAAIRVAVQGTPGEKFGLIGPARAFFNEVKTDELGKLLRGGPTIQSRVLTNDGFVVRMAPASFELRIAEDPRLAVRADLGDAKAKMSLAEVMAWLPSQHVPWIRRFKLKP